MKKPEPLHNIFPWTPAPPKPSAVAGEAMADVIQRQMKDVWAPALKRNFFALNAFLRPKAKLVRTRRGLKLVAGKLPRFRGGKAIKVPLIYGNAISRGGSWHSKP